jgi:hypothetical protein
MYLVPQYFVSFALRSAIVFKQEWTMVPSSALDTLKILFHVGGTWKLTGVLITIYVLFKFMMSEDKLSSPTGQLMSCNKN